MLHEPTFLVILTGIFTAFWFWFEVPRHRALRSYWTRSCQGRAWRRRFPAATPAEIRAFLGIVVENFGFGARRRLAFSPDDVLLEIYRACYSVEGWPDALELETLARALEHRYGVDLVSI
jgi:propanediol dehydratase small subunit